MTRYFGMLTILLTLGAQEIGAETLLNTWSTVGSHAILKCTTASGTCLNTSWSKLSGDGRTSSDIYKNGGILNESIVRYSVNNSSGCELNISSIKLSDAGRFTCTYTDTNKNTIPRSAFLIVLESVPKCEVNGSNDDTVEGDSVNFMCEVSYNGTNKTSIIWEDVSDAPPPEKMKNTIRRSFTAVAKKPTVPSHECIISFEVTMSADGVTNPINATCKTSPIKVLYPVTNVNLHPSLSVYNPGLNITCSADGNSPPTYVWQQMVEKEGNNDTWNDIATGPNFVVQNATSNRYRCVASNDVKNIRHSAFSHTFQINFTGDPGDDKVSSLDGIGVGAVGASAGVLLLLILTTTICCCVRSCPGYRCCHADQKSSGSDRQNDTKPLSDNTYAYATNGSDTLTQKTNPRPPPPGDPPKRPPATVPKPKARKNGQKKLPNVPHEEVQYACLAGEQDPHRVRNYHAPNLAQESEYADISRA